MKSKVEKQNIENAFVLILFAIFAIAVVLVLVLGARSYRTLANRDEKTYNRQIITSFISARIRNNDEDGNVAVGGFQKAEVKDEIETLHLYEKKDGLMVDTRIYYYDGYIYETCTLKGVELEYNAGTPIMEAKALSFEKDGNLVAIHATDVEGNESSVIVSLRSESEVAS